MSAAGGSMSTGTLGGDATLALPEFDRPPGDPMDLLGAWVDEAIERGVREPLAVSLATVDGEGCPSSRVVLVKALDARGLVFSSHHGSVKVVNWRIRRARR